MTSVVWPALQEAYVTASATQTCWKRAIAASPEAVCLDSGLSEATEPDVQLTVFFLWPEAFLAWGMISDTDLKFTHFVFSVCAACRLKKWRVLLSPLSFDWRLPPIHPSVSVPRSLFFRRHFLFQLAFSVTWSKPWVTAWVWASEQPEQGNCSATPVGTGGECCDTSPARGNFVCERDIAVRKQKPRVYTHNMRVVSKVHSLHPITVSTPSHFSVLAFNLLLIVGARAYHNALYKSYFFRSRLGPSPTMTFGIWLPIPLTANSKINSKYQSIASLPLYVGKSMENTSGSEGFSVNWY